MVLAGSKDRRPTSKRPPRLTGVRALREPVDLHGIVIMQAGNPGAERRSVLANGRSDSRRWVWYIVGAIVVLLLLGWLLGWFGGEVAEEAATDDGAVVEEPAATGEAAEEAAEDAAEEAGD